MSDVQALRFDDDGETPNNPRLPLLLYRGALTVAGFDDTAAAVTEAAESERIAVADVPLPFRGPAIALVTAGLMSLAFLALGLVVFRRLEPSVLKEL